MTSAYRPAPSNACSRPTRAASARERSSAVSQEASAFENACAASARRPSRKSTCARRWAASARCAPLDARSSSIAIRRSDSSAGFPRGSGDHNAEIIAASRAHSSASTAARSDAAAAKQWTAAKVGTPGAAGWTPRATTRRGRSNGTRKAPYRGGTVVSNASAASPVSCSAADAQPSCRATHAIGGAARSSFSSVPRSTISAAYPGFAAKSMTSSL